MPFRRFPFPSGTYQPFESPFFPQPLDSVREPCVGQSLVLALYVRFAAPPKICLRLWLSTAAFEKRPWRLRLGAFWRGRGALLLGSSWRASR